MLFRLTARALTVAPQMTTQCSTWGQFHYRTFDGRHFNFLGTCTYALAKDCQPGSDQFSLHVENDRACSDDVETCRRAVILYVNSKVYKVSTGYSTTVNGKSVTLPFKEVGITITRILSYIVVRALGNDIEIKFDGRSSIYVALSEEFINKTCGLCGNFNGAPQDDFGMVSGLQAKTTNEFGNSWAMVKPGESCSVVTKEPAEICGNARDEIRAAAKRMCSVLLEDRFQPCHSKVSPNDFIQRCEEDVCSCNFTQHSGCACDALTQYSRACANMKVTLNWRSQHLCRKFFLLVYVCKLK